MRSVYNIKILGDDNLVRLINRFKRSSRFSDRRDAFVIGWGID
jgi:hypothetical protein